MEKPLPRALWWVGCLALRTYPVCTALRKNLSQQMTLVWLMSLSSMVERVLQLFSSLTQSRFIAETVWQTFAWSYFRNTFTLHRQLGGTMWGCLSAGDSGSLQNLCVCWSAGLLEAPSQLHLPSLLSNLRHSHPCCCWVQGLGPLVGLLHSYSSPASAHWLLRLPWG